MFIVHNYERKNYLNKIINNGAFIDDLLTHPSFP